MNKNEILEILLKGDANSLSSIFKDLSPFLPNCTKEQFVLLGDCKKDLLYRLVILNHIIGKKEMYTTIDDLEEFVSEMEKETLDIIPLLTHLDLLGDFTNQIRNFETYFSIQGDMLDTIFVLNNLGKENTITLLGMLIEWDKINKDNLYPNHSLVEKFKENLKTIFGEKICYKLSMLDVKEEDLINIGIEKDIAYLILCELFFLVLQDPSFNSKEKMIEWARKEQEERKLRKIESVVE